MSAHRIVLVMIVLASPGAGMFAQPTPVEKGLNAITREAVQGQLEFLAADWTEGRETTTRGEYLAGDYIASMFKVYGLKPAGDAQGGNVGMAQAFSAPAWGPSPGPQQTRSYFQSIPFVESSAGESSLELMVNDGGIQRKYLFTQGADYTVSGTSVGEDRTAALVFIGYGFKSDSLGYDDFKGVDVRGKFVLRINGLPGRKDSLSQPYRKLNLGDRPTYWRLVRSKDDMLLKLGAMGVIDLPAGQPGGAANVPFRYNLPYYEGDKRLAPGSLALSLPQDSMKASLSRLSVSRRLLDEMLKGSGLNVDEFEKNAAATLKPGSKELNGRLLHLRSTVKTTIVRGRNVLGMIEGENQREVIVIGAHYDHVGTSGGYIWNGADDNASGTVGVMTVAKAMMAAGIKPKKTIIFAAWTGEEKGLLGSTYFVDTYRPVEDLILNLNFDMISRRPEADSAGYKMSMDYTEAYPLLKESVARADSLYDLGLQIQYKPSKQPMAGTDFTPFSGKKVPIIGFDAAFTRDYHAPTDHSDKADLDLMTKIIKVGFLSIYELSTMEKRIEPAR